ncbi:HAMP domain-containing sensor histidine kinase [Paenibacillus illinoisensis]|uniref:sensor histidine kinase n=1 Tax=Paenibacillus illinoisensis TaxID=59845 RepID=UPI003D2E53D4
MIDRLPWLLKKHSIRSNIVLSFGFSFLIASFMTFVLTFMISASPHLANLQTYGLQLLNFVPIVSIAFFVLFFFILTHPIIREIVTLESAIDTISDGDLNHRIPPMNFIELEIISLHINSMVEHIQDQIANERESDIAKKEWIEQIINELHTPLNTIVRNVDMLKRHLYQTDEYHVQIIHETYTAAVQLRKLINDLFQYARLSSHDIQLVFEDTDIVQVINHCLSQFIPVALEQGFLVEKQLPFTSIIGRIDREKIELAFHNILMHLMQHAVKPGLIRLSIRRDHNHLLIGVESNQRGTNLKAALGIHIARNIIELHRGALSLSSDNNIIIITLPLIHY